MSDGYIALWRKLRDNFLWRERRRFSRAEAWIDLLMDAHWQDGDVLLGGHRIHVKRGQVLFSQRKKAQGWGWARNSVHHFLSLLAKAEMVRHEVSRGPEGGYTLLTILKYDDYQPAQDRRGDRRLSHGARHALSHPCATPEPRVGQREVREKGEEGDGRAFSPSRSRSSGKAPEGYVEAVEHWFQEFERTRGAKPQFDAAEGACLKKLLSAHPVAQVKAIITHMLTRTRLRHIREGHRYSVRTIAGSWNELWDEMRQRSAEEGEALP